MSVTAKLSMCDAGGLLFGKEKEKDEGTIVDLDVTKWTGPMGYLSINENLR